MGGTNRFSLTARYSLHQHDCRIRGDLGGIFQLQRRSKGGPRAGPRHPATPVSSTACHNITSPAQCSGVGRQMRQAPSRPSGSALAVRRASRRRSCLRSRVCSGVLVVPCPQIRYGYLSVTSVTSDCPVSAVTYHRIRPRTSLYGTVVSASVAGSCQVNDMGVSRTVSWTRPRCWGCRQHRC
jgi:hypothetical protein